MYGQREFTKKKRQSTPRLFKAVAMKVERKKECLLVGEVSLLSVLGCHDVRVGLGVHLHVFEIFIHHNYSTRLSLL